VRKKGVAAAAEEKGGATWRDEHVVKRIEHALVKGIDTYIVAVRACSCSEHLLLDP
jgi:cobalamin-dependent methionine synthase I